MSRFWMTCLGACVCLCAMPGQASAQVARTRATTTAVKETPVRTIPQPGRSDARGVFEENIRVVLLVQRSSFQYGKSGAKASARLKIGRAITILKDPGKEISLELQSVDE